MTKRWIVPLLIAVMIACLVPAAMAIEMVQTVDQQSHSKLVATTTGQIAMGLDSSPPSTAWTTSSSQYPYSKCSSTTSPSSAAWTDNANGAWTKRLQVNVTSSISTENPYPAWNQAERQRASADAKMTAPKRVTMGFSDMNMSRVTAMRTDETSSTMTSRASPTHPAARRVGS